jgi:erythritol transport system ATP-binding protein
LKEILAVADRVLVMSRGRITGEFQIDQASEEALVRAASAKPGREGGERANP